MHQEYWIKHENRCKKKGWDFERWVRCEEIRTGVLLCDPRKGCRRIRYCLENGANGERLVGLDTCEPKTWHDEYTKKMKLTLLPCLGTFLSYEVQMEIKHWLERDWKTYVTEEEFKNLFTSFCTNNYEELRSAVALASIHGVEKWKAISRRLIEYVLERKIEEH